MPRIAAPAETMPSVFEQLPLQDIHLPAAVSWWPLAWGWWLVAAVVLLVPVALWALRRSLRPRLHAWRIRRTALRELEHIAERHRRDGDAALLLQDVSMWLRRVAISTHGRGIAGRIGDDWIQWLDAQSTRPGFAAALTHMLAEAPYRPSPDVDPVPLITACRAWVRHLRTKHD